MSAASTLAPSRTNTRVEARAMPEPAPVMTATLPSNSPMGPLFSWPARHAKQLLSMTASPDLNATGATRYAGARVHRLEDARLLTGHGTFVDDVVRPRMLHACF